MAYLEFREPSEYDEVTKLQSVVHKYVDSHKATDTGLMMKDAILEAIRRVFARDESEDYFSEDDDGELVFSLDGTLALIAGFGGIDPGDMVAEERWCRIVVLEMEAMGY